MILNQEKFVTRVFELMIGQNKKISDLAKATGLSEVTLKLTLFLSNDLSETDVFTIAKLAEAFNVTMEYLIGVGETQSIFVSSDWKGEIKDDETADVPVQED